MSERLSIRLVSVGILFTFNKLPQKPFWWYGNIFKKREVSFIRDETVLHDYQLSMEL